MKISWLKSLEEKLLRKPKIGTSVVKMKGGQVLNKQCTGGRSTWGHVQGDTRRPERK